MVCTGECEGGDSIERILRKLLERASCSGFKWLRSECGAGRLYTVVNCLVA